MASSSGDPEIRGDAATPRHLALHAAVLAPGLRIEVVKRRNFRKGQRLVPARRDLLDSIAPVPVDLCDPWLAVRELAVRRRYQDHDTPRRGLSIRSGYHARHHACSYAQHHSRVSIALQNHDCIGDPTPFKPDFRNVATRGKASDFRAVAPRPYDPNGKLAGAERRSGGLHSGHGVQTMQSKLCAEMAIRASRSRIVKLYPPLYGSYRAQRDF